MVAVAHLAAGAAAEVVAEVVVAEEEEVADPHARSGCGTYRLL
jgi:hypothetical protein